MVPPFSRRHISTISKELLFSIHFPLPPGSSRDFAPEGSAAKAQPPSLLILCWALHPVTITTRPTPPLPPAPHTVVSPDSRAEYPMWVVLFPCAVPQAGSTVQRLALWAQGGSNPCLFGWFFWDESRPRGMPSPALITLISPRSRFDNEGFIPTSLGQTRLS